MSERSRVEKYAELRKHIDSMDVYTFDDPVVIQKAADPVKDESKVSKGEIMTAEEIQQAHIKKNTLSLSIDELIKQHEEYTRTIEKAELDRKFKDLRKVKRSAKPKSTGIAWLLWIALAIVVISIAVCLGLIFGGVFK